jgi:hypothetical protein
MRSRGTGAGAGEATPQGTGPQIRTVVVSLSIRILLHIFKDICHTSQ